MNKYSKNKRTNIEQNVPKLFTRIVDGIEQICYIKKIGLDSFHIYTRQFRIFLIN